MYWSFIAAGSGTVKLIFTNRAYQLEFKKFSVRIFQKDLKSVVELNAGYLNLLVFMRIFQHFPQKVLYVKKGTLYYNARPFTFFPRNSRKTNYFLRITNDFAGTLEEIVSLSAGVPLVTSITFV